MIEYTNKIELSTNDNKNNTIPQIIIKSAKQNISAPVLLMEHENGTITKVIGKKRGNATYNFHMSAKINLINRQMIDNLKIDKKNKISNTIFCTLTTHYVPGSVSSSLQALENVKNRIPHFFRNIKNNLGDITFLWCIESHKNGGCHCHCVIQFNENKYQFFNDNNDKSRNDFLRDKIKKCWKIGNVDVLGVMNDNGVFNYVSKEIGKSQNVENAILRYEKNETLLKNDTNKIWLLGLSYLYKKNKNKNVRFLGYSKNLTVSNEDVENEKLKMINEYKIQQQMIDNNSLENETNALINNMNKSSFFDDVELLEMYNNSKKNKVVRFVMLDKKFAKHNLKYYYKSGQVVDKNELEICKSILDKYSLPTINDKIELASLFTKK